MNGIELSSEICDVDEEWGLLHCSTNYNRTNPYGAWIPNFSNRLRRVSYVYIYFFLLFIEEWDMGHGKLVTRWPFMMTSSNGNISALLALCEGNSPVTDEFPSQSPVTRSFGVFFDLRLNKRLSKQSIRLWFETPSHPLWRHRNVIGLLWCYPAM